MLSECTVCGEDVPTSHDEGDAIKCAACRSDELEERAKRRGEQLEASNRRAELGRDTSG